MYEAQLRNALKSKKIDSKQTKQKEKHKTKRTQSENKNGFADGMKWLAIFAIILFAWFISWKIHKYIATNG
jgi:cytoskeletal protein RodZ